MDQVELKSLLDEWQKERKVANWLTKLRRAGQIANTGSRAHPFWRLAERMQK